MAAHPPGRLPRCPQSPPPKPQSQRQVLPRPLPQASHPFKAPSCEDEPIPPALLMRCPSPLAKRLSPTQVPSQSPQPKAPTPKVPSTKGPSRIPPSTQAARSSPRPPNSAFAKAPNGPLRSALLDQACIPGPPPLTGHPDGGVDAMLRPHTPKHSVHLQQAVQNVWSAQQAA